MNRSDSVAMEEGIAPREFLIEDHLLLAVLDAAGELRVCNASLENLLLPQETGSSAGFSDIVEPASVMDPGGHSLSFPGMLGETARRAIMQGQVLPHDQVLKTPGGHEHHVHWNLNPLTCQHGREALAVAVGTVLQDDMVEKWPRGAGARVSGDLSAMLAEIIHEVKQPLTALTVNAETALARLENPDCDPRTLHALLWRIAEQGGRAQRVLQEMRELSGGGSLSQPGREDLNQLVRYVLFLVSDELTAHHVHVETSLAGDLRSVEVKRTQIEQILVNLITNAVEAMGDMDRRKSLVVETRTVPEKGQVRVDIRDNGHGFDSDHGNRLFEPLYSTRETGRGQGLAISRTLAQHNGGYLEASGTPGKGSRFSLLLPVCTQERVDENG